MSALLPVLPSAGVVTGPGERFRCTRLSAVLFARACVARQTATRYISPTATQVVHPVCAGCPEGHALAARLEGREIATPEPVRVAPERERERCPIAGCSSLAGLVDRRTIPGTEHLCGYHRGEARRHMRQRGVDLSTSLAWIAAGRRPALERAAGDACAVEGCEDPRARASKRLVQAWACLCGRHRIVASNRQVTRPRDTAEQVLAHVLRTATGPRRAPSPRRNPAESVAAEARREMETQHKVALARADLRSLLRQAAKVRARIGSLTGRSA